MLTVDKLIPGGARLARTLIERAARVTLDWDVRQKSRFDAVDSTGRALAVFLPRGTAARGGDLLVAEDGSLIRVDAASQPVLIVRTAQAGDDRFGLMRAAYHLGNRHVQLELRPDHLKLEPDPVLADMLRRMGLRVEVAEMPFEPEGGAYGGHAMIAGGHGHGHAHGESHGHGHAHGEAHGHGHAHGHRHAHPDAGTERATDPGPRRQ